MTEELFIFIDGKRERIDLKRPSGIVLSFESNLFNALDRVNCSRSYTFNLPMTQSNRRVFGLADDIRSNGVRVGQRFKAEYIVNGVNICPNANIYINNIAGTYNAVMTWGVLQGLQTLRDEDVNINELETDAEKTTIDNNIVARPQSDNQTDYAKPLFPSYHCGVVAGSNAASVWLSMNPYPLPVISTKMLLDRINARFGVNILKTDDGAFVNDSIINLGVVPAIRAALHAEQQEQIFVRYGSPFLDSAGTVHFNNIQDQTHNECHLVSDYGFRSKNVHSLVYAPTVSWEGNATQNIRFKIEGKIRAINYSGNEPIYLQIVQGDNVVENRISEFSYLGILPVYLHEWNIGDEYNEPFEISMSVGDEPKPFYFRFATTEDNTMIAKNFSFSDDSYLKVYPINDDGGVPHLMDCVYSLPEIKCLEFVKSLFYMMGAFPKAGANGNVIPIYYKDIFANLDEGNVYDYSKRVINNDQNPKEINWKVGDFSQHNYLCTKSDKPENNDDTKSYDDVFATGYCDVKVENEFLPYSSTMVQVPFNAPFERNGKNPKMATGRTFKYWDLQDGELTASQAGAIYGFGYISMSCWAGFVPDVLGNDKFEPLRRLVSNPKVVQIELMLNEYDLITLDYAKPVYLEQYSSYFAIIKIERTSNGICNAELLKINL